MNIETGLLLFYAPNVHTGGGFILLQALIKAWPNEQPFVAWLDERVRGRLALPESAKIHWVKASLGSRLLAEISLARAGCSEDRVLCFHGLPTLLRNKSPIMVFQQNRNYLGGMSLQNFSWKTRQRLRFEQFISRLFRHRVASYWVQTPSMRQAIRSWYGAEPAEIQVLPFMLSHETGPRVETKSCDFVYVADGEAHKNHRRLIQAWELLAEEGLRPSLVLTLSERDTALAGWVEERSRAYGLRIVNLGQKPHAEVLALYGEARALIFPSLSESFGLPLVEASEMSLPILAGELDFVRDVCEPAQSFDPNSPVSIARAVKRFLGKDKPPVQPVSADEFLRAIIHDEKV